jgi:hypothetical protein
MPPVMSMRQSEMVYQSVVAAAARHQVLNESCTSMN